MHPTCSNPQCHLPASKCKAPIADGTVWLDPRSSNDVKAVSRG